MTRSLGTILLAGSLQVILSGPARAVSTDVVVLPLLAEEVDAEVAEGIAVSVGELAAEQPGFRVLGTTKRLRKMAERCRGADLRCLAKAADRRGADLALFGSLRGAGERLELQLRLLDVAESRALGEAVEPLAGGESELREGVRRAVIQVLAPERYTGTVSVGCNVPGARIRVDGNTRGKTPLHATLDDLRAGSHTVQVDKHGYEPYEETVEVGFERNTHVQAALLRRTDISVEEIAATETAEAAAELPWRPGLGPWSWVLSGAGGALVLAGVGTGIATLVTVAGVEQRAAYQVLSFPHDAEAVEQGRLLAVLTNSFYALGALVAAGGVTLGIWDLLVPPPTTPATPLPPPAHSEESWDAEVLRPPDDRDGHERETERPAVESLEPPPDQADEDTLPDGDGLPEGDL